MTLEIAALPLWLSVLLFVVIPTLAFMCGPILLRQLFGVESIMANNEVAGFKFATLGVVFAVLLGLAVIAVWEKYADAEAATAQEAGAIASMHRLANGLASPEDQEAFRASLVGYVQSAIDQDWPAMAEGRESRQTHQALDNLYQSALGAGANDAGQATVLDAILDQLDVLTNARRDRLAAAGGNVPNVVWLVLLAGAALTLGFTFFFGLHNLHAQVLMTGTLALLVSLALLVAASIDHPFTGPVRIAPENITSVLDDLGPPSN